MKKTKRIAFLAALGLLLSGCGGYIPPNYGESSVAEAPAPAAEISAPEKKEEESTYIWYLEPFLETEDVNLVAEEALDYNYGWFLDTDYPVMQQNGKFGVIDYNGNVLVEPTYTSVGGELNTAYAHYGFFNPGENGDWYFCVQSHDVGVSEYRECALCGERFSTTVSGYGYFYDPDRKVTGIYEPGCVHMEETDYALGLNGQYVFAPETTEETVMARCIALPDDYASPALDSTGTVGTGFAAVRGDQMLTDFEFTEATDYKDGVAAVCKDDKWGYIDQDGKTIIPFEYDADLVFSNAFETVEWSQKAKYYPYVPSEGYIALNKGDQAGYADTKGGEIVPVGTFKAARPVHDSLAWVQDADSGLWGVISFDKNRTPAEAPAETEAPETEPEESEEVPAEDTDGWREAYAEVLRSSNAEQFSLVYVDDNDIPELAVHLSAESSHANTSISLYTYYNGEAVLLGENLSADGYNYFGYAERQGYVLSSWVQMGYIITTYLKLENGTLTTEHDYFTDEASQEGYENPTYKIDDVAVPKADYDASISQYSDIQWTFETGDYFNEESCILAYILQ